MPAFPYQPSLDGVRAVAVLAVMAYHAKVPWVAGGYLGVDVFFVLSGYLITSLLQEERTRDGAVSLSGFWVRRGLRLVPALALLAIVLLAGSFVLSNSNVSRVGTETVATLLYVSNWAQIIGFVSPLGYWGHSWSLAIEGQFYLLWPLVFVCLSRRRSPIAIMGLLIGGAGASAVLREHLLVEGETFLRVFHGSDTRMDALLAGCALGLVFRAGGQVPILTRSVRIGLSAASLAAAVVLSVLLVRPFWIAEVVSRSAAIFVTTLAVVLVVAETGFSPDGPLARALSARPLAAVGRISYGLYLWHWPVFLVLTSQSLGMGDPATTGARFAATFAVAIASWVLVEKPALRRKRSFARARSRQSK
jgi:peptidoglycan/LPS O-acetylase OafA/YrhL